MKVAERLAGGRKKRGSAMLFVSILIAAMTAAIAVTITVVTHALQTQTRIEDAAKAKLYLDGASQRILAEYETGSLVIPSLRTFKVGAQDCTVYVSTAGLTTPHTLRLELATMIKGRTFSEVRVAGARRKPSPFYYALAVNNGLTTPGRLTTGWSGANGDVYARGNLQVQGQFNTVHGELEAKGSIAAADLMLSGNMFANVSEIPFPQPSSSAYQSAATATLGTSLDGYAFTATASDYPILYAPGNLNLRGAFKGRGVIFVNGVVTIAGPMSYVDSGSALAVIATGDITFNAASAVGYFYGGVLTTPASGLTISRGGLAANSATIGGPLSVTHDSLVWLSAEEGRRLRLPGFWP